MLAEFAILSSGVLSAHCSKGGALRRGSIIEEGIEKGLLNWDFSGLPWRVDLHTQASFSWYGTLFVFLYVLQRRVDNWLFAIFIYLFFNLLCLCAVCWIF